MNILHTKHLKPQLPYLKRHLKNSLLKNFLRVSKSGLMFFINGQLLSFQYHNPMQGFKGDVVCELHISFLSFLKENTKIEISKLSSNELEFKGEHTILTLPIEDINLDNFTDYHISNIESGCFISRSLIDLADLTDDWDYGVFRCIAIKDGYAYSTDKRVIGRIKASNSDITTYIRGDHLKGLKVTQKDVHLVNRATRNKEDYVVSLATEYWTVNMYCDVDSHQQGVDYASTIPSSDSCYLTVDLEVTALKKAIKELNKPKRFSMKMFNDYIKLHAMDIEEVTSHCKATTSMVVVEDNASSILFDTATMNKLLSAIGKAKELTFKFQMELPNGVLDTKRAVYFCSNLNIEGAIMPQ